MSWKQDKRVENCERDVGACGGRCDNEEQLFLLDAEEQLMSMKLSDNDDSKAHLAEIKQHFQLMLQRHENLIKMGSTLSDTRLIMTSLPESYLPTLQTIMAAE